MKKLIILAFIFLSGQLVIAQIFPDTILTNERKIDRPITLHKGQFQFNPAYEISILSKSYDNDGNKEDLAELGSASVLHRYLFEVNYGILDFIQASIALNYSKRGERSENVMIYSTVEEPYYDISYFNDYKGFEDFYLGLKSKLPIKSKKFEFGTYLGISLPLSKNKYPEPNHSITLPTSELPFTKLNYHYKHKMGSKTSVFNFGLQTILRTGDKFGFRAELDYNAPLSESKDVLWTHEINGTDFEYHKTFYNYLVSNKLFYQLGIEYQAISWFNIELSFSKVKTTKGWSEITGLRIENRETKLSVLSIAYEIKVTSQLWLSQSLNFPTGGKNTLGPFMINTGISYNLFPFR